MSGITGTWSASMNTPFGKQDLTITLEGGEPPSGLLHNSDGESVVENLVLTEDTATFTLPIEKPIKAKVVWSLRAEGDVLAGTVKAGFFPASKLAGTRAVAGASV